MKSPITTLALAALFSEAAVAFPAALWDKLTPENAGSLAANEKRTVGFNAALQYVSNKGAHAFVAPGLGDARGPCPGLNAMANHKYVWNGMPIRPVLIS